MTWTNSTVYTCGFSKASLRCKVYEILTSIPKYTDSTKVFTSCYILTLHNTM